MWAMWLDLGPDDADRANSRKLMSHVSGTDKTSGLNDKISVRLTFNEAVNVDTAGGTPSLKIKIGPSLNELATAYATGNGTKSLVFRYTVVSPNKSTTGVAVIENTLALNSGTIRSVETGEDAKLGHTGVVHDSNHLVDSSPPAPTGLSAEVGNTRITLRWTDPGDASITKYQDRARASGGQWSPDWTDITGSGAATTSYTVPGLTNDTTYTVQLRAVRGEDKPGPVVQPDRHAQAGQASGAVWRRLWPAAGRSLSVGPIRAMRRSASTSSAAGPVAGTSRAGWTSRTAARPPSPIR